MDGDPIPCDYPEPIPCEECGCTQCEILADGNIRCCGCEAIREVPNADGR